MPGDRVTSEDGRQVEFPHTRKGGVVRVVQQRTAVLALVGGLVTGGGGSFAAARFMLTAAIQQEIKQHDRDPEAHAPLVRAAERWRESQEFDSAEKQRLHTQLDALSKDVRETREAVIRLEAQLRRGGR